MVDRSLQREAPKPSLMLDNLMAKIEFFGTLVVVGIFIAITKEYIPAERVIELLN